MAYSADGKLIAIANGNPTRILRANGTSRVKGNWKPSADILDAETGKTIVSASTIDKGARQDNGGNCQAAKAVGASIAERAKAAGIDRVVFDRSGFAYHGRVKAVAEAARKAGLKV